jgi:hypothetical protein
VIDVCDVEHVPFLIAKAEHTIFDAELANGSL